MKLLKWFRDLFGKKNDVDKFESLKQEAKEFQQALDEYKEPEKPQRKYRHSLSFRTQQLQGKILIFGKIKWRVQDFIQRKNNKFQYYVSTL